jgi:carbamoyl-phosphate synthase small subunit
VSGERALLALADGTIFPGEAFGADGVAVGEVVFTTGLTGYQEVLTDPSYCGQLVTMTAPHIGNTGVVREDHESADDQPHVAGLLVRDASEIASNHRADETLDAFLRRHGVCALTGIDTRKLTRHLRDHGSQNGAIGRGTAEAMVRRAREAPSMAGLDLVPRVSCREPYEARAGRGAWATSPAREARFHVVAFDFGLKQNILRCLVDAGCRVTVVPAQTSAAEALALAPDGVFLSNGPGDPAAVTYGVEAVRGLLGRVPLFGICLGHQLLAHALGASTYKLKFGHRGLNQPVLDLTTGRVAITSQNHGFVVDPQSLAGRADTTHVHLNDRTSEGLSVPSLRAFSVQFHPEAAAGPHDALDLFDRFCALMERGAAPPPAPPVQPASP